MNSGAPASTAPPDFSSLGIIMSQRARSVAYCEAEKIFDIVCLAKAVEHGSFGIGAHARGADFVNDSAAGLDAERQVAMDGSSGLVFAAHGFDDGFECFLHVLGLEQLVIGPFEVEAKNWNAPLIDDLGIDFAVGVGVGDHFTAARKANVAAIHFASALL